MKTAARFHLLREGYKVQCQASVQGVGHLDLLVDGILGLEMDGEQYPNASPRHELMRSAGPATPRQ